MPATKNKIPTLRRIELPGDHEESNSSCEHDDINEDGSYLCLIYDCYYAGGFSRQWYGWNFNNWGNSGIQLNSSGIQGVWEIVS